VSLLMNYYPNYRVGVDGTNQDPETSWLVKPRYDYILQSINRALEDLASGNVFTYQEVFGER